jgi:NADPH:quinone reductase-like Zn-dependent oxidoreductase
MKRRVFLKNTGMAGILAAGTAPAIIHAQEQIRWRLVTCGATSGFDGRTDLRALFAKHLSIHGSYMGRLAEFEEVVSHIRRGALRPVLDRVLPLADARAAHEAMERREQFGKIVLVP